MAQFPEDAEEEEEEAEKEQEEEEQELPTPTALRARFARAWRRCWRLRAFWLSSRRLAQARRQATLGSRRVVLSLSEH